jgi:uncharacterized protein YgiM (DUF1202 family)
VKIMPKRTVIIVGLLAAVVLIYIFNGTKSNANGSTPAPAANQCQVSVTADVLNVRKAADPKAEVVGKYQQGAKVNAAKLITNGFRQIGDDRWVAAKFVKPVSGSSCG